METTERELTQQWEKVKDIRMRSQRRERFIALAAECAERASEMSRIWEEDVSQTVEDFMDFGSDYPDDWGSFDDVAIQWDWWAHALAELKAPPVHVDAHCSTCTCDA